MGRAEAPADHGELGETERRILTAALEIFSEKGFSGASTASIAARAGVAEKTLFARFRTKDELLRRTLRPSVFLLIEPRAIDRAREALDARGRDARGVIGAFVRDRLALAAAHPKKLKLVLHELLLRPELLTNLAVARERLLPAAEKAFADLARRGELRKDLPIHTVLRTLVCVIVGLAVVRHVLKLEGDLDEDQLDQEVERVVSLLVDGLRPR